MADSDDDDNVMECGICLDVCVDPVTAGGACRRHNFCKADLERWIDSQVSAGRVAKCPNCNLKIQQSTDNR